MYFVDDKSLSKKLDDTLKKWDYNGTVYVTHNGIKLFEGAYGMADFEENIANEMDSTFSIASITKQFTAACIMLLYEKNMLDIEDTLDKFLPEYSHAKKITIRQLMNMASGIPDYVNDVIEERMHEEKKTTTLSPRDFYIYSEQSSAEYFTTMSVLSLVNELPLQFTPGEKMQYSNTNYFFLDRVIKRISGISTGEFMKEYIFKPLGMTHTCVGSQHSTAVSYDYFEGERVWLGRGKLSAGDGSIVTTAEDLSLWLNAVLDGRILKESSWQLVFEMFNHSYGFGWQMDGIWYHHDGGNLGYQSYVYISFEKKLAIAMTANIPGGGRAGESIFYKFQVKAPTTGQVRMKLGQMNSGAAFNLYTIDIYDDSTKTLLASIGRNSVLEEKVLWALKNEGENAEAETFSVNEEHIYSLDLKQVLGEKFSSDATYRIEASVSSTEYTIVNASYQSDQDKVWVEAMGIYIGADLIEEKLPKILQEEFTFSNTSI